MHYNIKSKLYQQEEARLDDGMNESDRKPSILSNWMDPYHSEGENTHLIEIGGGFRVTYGLGVQFRAAKFHF